MGECQRQNGGMDIVLPGLCRALDFAHVSTRNPCAKPVQLVLYPHSLPFGRALAIILKI
jgi:hypothetical protein